MSKVGRNITPGRFLFLAICLFLIVIALASVKADEDAATEAARPLVVCFIDEIPEDAGIGGVTEIQPFMGDPETGIHCYRVGE